VGTDHRVKVKEARKGVVDQRPVGGKNKKPRPVILEHRSRPESPLAKFFPEDTQEWRKWKAYRSEAEAIRAMEKLKQQYHLSEFRIREQTPS
jgi:hypothetical protein